MLYGFDRLFIFQSLSGRHPTPHLSVGNIVLFIGLGIVAIFSAILYTMGKKPYGYHAKGELAMFIFFGLVNVLGSLYLQSQYIRVSDIIMATSVGLLCTCVLMINNMRDIDSDQLAQKKHPSRATGQRKNQPIVSL